MAKSDGVTSMNRRGFLRVAGAATGVGVAAGIPALVAAQKAPSFPKGTKLNILEWVSFVPASDVEFKRLAAEFAKLAGVEVTVDLINMNDLNPRIASAIETKSGPDIIMMISNWPHLYADGLADVDDVAEEISKRDGAYYEHNRKVSVVGNSWKAVPLCSAPRRGRTVRTGSRKPALSWNEFLYALVFLSSPQQKTIPIGVFTELVRGDVFYWGPLMAGALLGSIPVALVYSFFVEHYVTALTGAVKG